MAATPTFKANRKCEVCKANRVDAARFKWVYYCRECWNKPERYTWTKAGLDALR